MKKKLQLFKMGLIVLTMFVITTGLTAADYGAYGKGVLFKDQTFHFETIRVMGGNTGEVLQTIKNIKAGDFESWYVEWKKTAERIEKLGDSYVHDNVSRGEAYARAHGYYRSAEFFMLHGDPRKEETTAKVYEMFYKSLDALKVEYHRFDIPYGDYKLKANFYPGKEGAEDKPLIVLVCGYDSIKEEQYFATARAALERGYSVLTYDGPGQGQVIREQGLVFTHEWEKPNGAVLDTFIEKFYEPKKIVLIGDSLGGILVTRAAAHDKRIDGIVNLDIFYDYLEASTWDIPKFFIDMVMKPEGATPMAKMIMKSMMKNDPVVRWAMTHGSWVLGAPLDEPWNVLRKYPPYTVKDIGHLVTCDVLLLAGEKDHFVPVELMEKNIADLPNTRSLESIIYDEESAGHEHCQVGAEGVLNGDMFSWIARRFPTE